MKEKKLIPRFLSIISILVLWHLFSTQGWLDIPAPAKTFEVFLSLLFTGDPAFNRSLFQLALASIRTVILGSTLGFVLAVPAGLLIGCSRFFRDFLTPFMELMRPIPPLAWIPMAYILFAGSGSTTFHVQVFIVFLGVFFPTLMNTVHGVRSIDPIYYDAAKVMGTRPHQMLRRVIIPASLPSIFTGIRIGVGIGWMCIVAAEFVGGKMGLGFYIWAAYNLGGKEAEIISGMISIGLIGYAMNRCLLEIERRLLPWRSE